jgi:hypothetical protein
VGFEPPPNEGNEVDGTQALPAPADARQAASARPAPPDPSIGLFIQGRTSEELLDIIFQSTLELRRRANQDTSKVSTGRLPDIPVSFIDASVGTFVRVPAPSAPETDTGEAHPWRIVLLSANPAHPPLALEIHHDAIVGRGWGETQPDLDLTAYGGEGLGVSRRHAMLRPTKDSLLLADVGSSNGTFYNGVRIKLGEPRALKDNDIISFGALHLRVKIASRPAGTPE